MIRIARYEDLIEILLIVKETIDTLQKQGNFQWSKDYPTKKHFEQDINNAHLYVYEIDNEVGGFICINNIENKEYYGLPWRKKDKAIVIHRFAVKRKYQRQKTGTKLMKFVESYAFKKGINYIKVDTNTKNIRMNALF